LLPLLSKNQIEQQQKSALKTAVTTPARNKENKVLVSITADPGGAK